MKFYSFKQKLTKKWLILLLALLILFIYFLIWFLIGQYDFLNKDWIIPSKGKIWSGIIDENNINLLKQKYPNFTWESIELGKRYTIKNNGVIILNIFYIYILLSITFFLLLFQIILKIFKIINYDCLSFTLSFNIVGFLFSFADLIPNFDNQFARNLIIFVILLITLTTFFILNTLIFNSILIKHDNSFEIKQEYKQEEQVLEKETYEIKERLK
ncbi:MAG: hypothetical protein LBF02_01670 [Mycoplasmataceae bacterium]|nr:hypothetical protein [Mycoplasmataceae bacterium]